MCGIRPTKIDVIRALQALEGIERPEGDNEGSAINSDAVYHKLSIEQQGLVDHAENLARQYVSRHVNEGNQPDKRSINELNTAGYSTEVYASFGRVYGKITLDDEWELDVSEPADLDE